MPEGIVEAIFITPAGGVPMQRIDGVDALAGRGLAGDRYAVGAGHWAGDTCHVTLIAAEGLDDIARETGIRVGNGEHRRNIVTRGIGLDELAGRRFRVGRAVFAYDRPRPPCRYLESLTEPGMTRALSRGRHGVCALVLASGRIRVGDRIVPDADGDAVS